jgi:UPF0716 protein FxsA
VCGVLALLFIAVPAVEIYLIIKIGSLIGAGATFGVIILTGIAGAALARTQGFAAMRSVQESLTRGDRIGTSLAGAALVLVAGVMMLTPGFLTDICGLALLVPPIRHRVAGVVVRNAAGRVVTHIDVNLPGAGPGRRAGNSNDDESDPPPPGVIDV